jgi:hypothetical protein
MGRALVLAARRSVRLELVVSVGARASRRGAGDGQLTWSQLEALKRDGAVDASDSRGRPRRVECSPADLEGEGALPLEGLNQCGGTHFLVLHGSQDGRVPPTEAEKLRPFLVGAASHEVRTPSHQQQALRRPARVHASPHGGLPRAGARRAGRRQLRRPRTDALVRHPRLGVAAHYLSDCPLSAAAAVPPLGLQPGRQPSGFNIFVESLTTAVDEIHRDVRTNLPSMDVGGEDEDEDSDGEAEEPILTARGARRHSWENR